MSTPHIRPRSTKPRAAKFNTGKVPAGILFQIQASSADIRIRKIAHAIERHQFDSIRQLAKLVDLSESRLSHVFKEQTGLRLSEMLVKQRLERAAHLLRSTEMTVREISHQVGYRHAPSFVRAFKRMFDCSPIVHRIRERLYTEAYRGLALRPKGHHQDEKHESLHAPSEARNGRRPGKKEELN